VVGTGPGAPILPSPFAPQVEVAVVVDTSGSMGRKEMEAALAELDGILRSVRGEVRVVSCDAEVQKAGKVTRAADAAKLLKGGGGTDFVPAFDHLVRHRPGVTIVVTDGHGPAPDDEPRWTDTVWLLVGKDTRTPYPASRPFGGDVQWGEVIKVGAK
jgi:predicted metal-dependent peptidase